MIEGLPTLDDIDYSGKRILMRIDINAPIVNSTILDTTRFESHVPTLKELEDCRVVLLAHQSRAGKKDFTSLETHAKTLSRLLGKEVDYVDDLFGSCAINRIKEMDTGYLLLENVRFYAEETLKRDAIEHSKSLIVRRLSPLFDFYVNDAFSASHRSQASLVGFPPVIPSVVGRLVEKEVAALSKAIRSEKDKIFILGGAKISDSVKVLKNVLERGIASKVVLTGVVANYFLMLDGVKLGPENEKVVEENKEGINDEEMLKTLKAYRDKIILPEDFGVEIDGKRKDISVEEFRGDGRIMDIGVETISMLSEEIPKHSIAVINGPAGVFEDEKFALGTFEVLKAVSRAEFSLVGGGHISTAARMVGLDKKMSHVSTGGGASIRYLSGEKLVGLEVVREFWEKKWSKELGG
ncbi:phosphoglycerate kinase [Archaeoglobus sulfaticallidus PM70-1]|uniref:Phosphoglycerate kinase n=1 Tax=Archaeoglobus sulfaticallidus PM70-1 TaxID=387631 RepID=N0BD15_9EURY|nr:phosphoglycerate kinase [Archaeoglobus sulfaticallidus]AGK60908.1 phosphoglycerate kinase [Archaeoglobus sulfaticallidus PM70-1]